MVQEIVDFFMAPLLRVNMERIIGDSIEEHSPDIIELNLAQLEAGQTAEGEEIRPFYKPITVKIKKTKGQPTDRVTLKDEGSFYGGFRTEPAPGGTAVTSTDEKTAALVKKYSLDIFGLSVASREQLRDRLRPTVQDKFRQALS